MKKTIAHTCTTTQFQLIVALVAVTISTVTGCATTSNITPQYISPNAYKSYDCHQLSNEYNRITSYIKNTQAKKFSLASTGVDIGLHGNRNGIYPTVNFGVGQNDAQEIRNGELSRLYGESDAVIQSARITGCHFADNLRLFNEK